VKIFSRIIKPVTVDMVNYFPGLGPGDFTMFPLSAVSLTAITQAMRSRSKRSHILVRFFNSGVRRLCARHVSDRGNHTITTAIVLARRKATDFQVVRMQWVAMSMPHLVMPHAHFTRGHRPIAVQAGSSNHLAAPTIIRRAMSFLALVMHEAKTMRSMLAVTSVNRAFSICRVSGHQYSSFLLPLFYLRYKALGNSMAIPPMRWLGQRIAMVDSIQRLAVAA
jgi:hypothetical protein